MSKKPDSISISKPTSITSPSKSPTSKPTSSLTKPSSTVVPASKPSTAVPSLKSPTKLTAPSSNNMSLQSGKNLITNEVRRHNLIILESVPLLSKLSTKERAELVDVMNDRKYSKGDKIISQGDWGDEFFVIQSGKVIVSKQDTADSPSIELDQLKEGDYFGEAALLKNVRRGATVTAATEVHALSLDRDRFVKLVGVHRLDGKFGKRNAINSAAVKDPNANSEEANVIGKLANAMRQKDDAMRIFLTNAVSKNILFQGFDEEQVAAIVDDMFRIDIAAQTTVIKQGDFGDFFYVVEKGRFEIFVANAKVPNAPLINVHDPKLAGQSFGELALLYNAPRNATVVAAEPSVLWAVERHAFRKIVSRVSAKKLAEYEQVIRNVPVFTLLTQKERNSLAEALEVKSFQSRGQIVNQNAINDTLYIMIGGEAIATQQVTDSHGKTSAVEVARLFPGDFFGDKALIQDECIPASVHAVLACQCVCLDRTAFIRLVGPIEELLARAKRGQAEAEEKAASDAQVAKKRSIVSYNRKKDFDVVGILGHGSFATVSLVREKKTKETYALKALARNSIIVPAQRQHVMNERNVLASLDSPFLVKLHGNAKDDTALCFVLEACLAGELFAVMHQQVRLSEASAKFYGACVILGFEYMHQRNIIYRDLKPENLMLADNGYVKIADFGLAKQITDRTFTVCGTPDYLAPEVVCGQGHGKAVDWWTLGVLMFEMMVGEPPFFDEDIMQTYQKIINASVTFPGYLSPQAVDFLRNLLQPKPAKRLGCGRNGASDLKNHPWFAGFDWSGLENCRLKAPFQPVIKNREDLSNFEDFSSEPIQDFPSVPDNSGWDAEF